MQPKIICFGETLWDILPSGKMPGGAPMNVAIHLKYNGHSPAVLSRVGNDDLGKALLDFLTEKGISTEYIQIDEIHQTGIVEANISNKTQVSYTIVEPVAWDYIQYDELLATLVSESDVFIYGSLVSRNKTSCDTLFSYLPLAKLKVFDVNLRPPHYSPKRIQQLMTFANVIKMNHNELTEIMSWYGKALPEQESMEYLQQRFNPKMLVVTRGEDGASVLTNEGYFEHLGFRVKVEDTIGSGDAFLATFLSKTLQHTDTPKALEIACATGTYVATQRGATPLVSEESIYRLMSKPFVHQSSNS